MESNTKIVSAALNTKAAKMNQQNINVYVAIKIIK